LTVYSAFSTIAPITQALKVEIVISTPKTSWNYVIDRIPVKPARLARELVALKNALTNLAPTCSASSVAQCTCH
jgi:hypothetical protein